MASSFQQRLKGGFERFDPAEFYPRYRRLEVFDSVLGRERVSLWKFDPARFPEGDVVRDFCARLGIEIAPDDVVRVNESLSLPAMSILFAYRVHGPGYGEGPQAVRENWALARALQDVPGAKFRFHESAVAPVLEDNREDLGLDRGPAWGGAAPRVVRTEGVRSGEELLAIDRAAVSALIAAVETRLGVELPRIGDRGNRHRPARCGRDRPGLSRGDPRVLFGSGTRRRNQGTRAGSLAAATERLVAELLGSRARWRQADVIVLAPTARQHAVVGFELPAHGRDRRARCSPLGVQLERLAACSCSDSPSQGDGEEGRVLGEINVEGRADREWRVPVAIDSPDQGLRLSCTLTGNGTKGAAPAFACGGRPSGRLRVSRPPPRRSGQSRWSQAFGDQVTL